MYISQACSADTNLASHGKAPLSRSLKIRALAGHFFQSTQPGRRGFFFLGGLDKEAAPVGLYCRGKDGGKEEECADNLHTIVCCRSIPESWRVKFMRRKQTPTKPFEIGQVGGEIGEDYPGHAPNHFLKLMPISETSCPFVLFFNSKLVSLSEYQ